MNKPEVMPTVSGYAFLWKEEHLHVKVTRVKAHRDGRVTGELMVSLNGSQPPVIVKPHTEFNFLADPRRSSLAKGLKEDLPDVGWNWNDVIDAVSMEVVDRARAGEPLEFLMGDEQTQRPEWILKPYIMAHLPTIVFGEKGVFKSTTTQMMMAAITVPWIDNPLGLSVPFEPVSCLWLDWETDKNIFDWNLYKLRKGMGIEGVCVNYRRCYLPLAEDIEQIEEYIERTKAKVIFIDSLAQAAGGDLIKDTDRAIAFFAALRQTNAASYIIAQTSKSDEGKKSPFGSVLFTYYARNIFELYRPDETDPSIGLFHRWSNVSALTPPVGFRVTVTDDSTVVESQAVTVDEFRKKVSASAKILDSLRHGSSSVSELAEACNLDRNETDQAIYRLKKSGKIVKLANGSYGLAKRD